MERNVQLEHLTGDLVQVLTDAESSQRGYLLTGRGRYLEPYERALERIPIVEKSFLDQLRTIPYATINPQRVHEAVAGKVEVLQRTVVVFRREGRDGILTLLNTDIGRQKMDDVRLVLAEVEAEARKNWTARMALLDQTLRRASWLIYMLGFSVCLLLAAGTWRLVRSIARSSALLQQLEKQQNQYHRLALMLQKGHEEERAAMARRVHDEIGQNLTAAKLDIGISLRRLEQPESARGTMQRAIETLEQTLHVSRDIATELRPPVLDQLGLIAAVDWQLKKFRNRFGGQTTWDAEVEERAISASAKLALFRVLQEALTNVVRHAGASKVEIRISRLGPDVAMSVADDGVGMNAEHAVVKSLGLLGMRERMRAVGGELEIHSEIGKGAKVTARVPAAVDT